MTMNPTETSAGGGDLPAALANRMVHLPWKADMEYSVDCKRSGEWPTTIVPLKEGWERHIRLMGNVTATYLKHMRTDDHLCKVPEKDIERSGPWPSPRTWDMVDILLAACEGAEWPDEELKGMVTSMLIRGTIGHHEADMFFNWWDNLDLPDPREALNDPRDVVFPDRADKLYIFLGAVAAEAVSSGPTVKDWEAAWAIFKQAAANGYTAEAAVSVRELARCAKADLPLPRKLVEPFLPLLKGAGLIS